MTFVLVHHALFLSTRLLYCRLLNCLLVWSFDRLLVGNCDYFVCTFLSGWTGFGGFDTHWTPVAPLMIIAARSFSAHNSVGRIEPVNTAPVMYGTVFIFVADFFYRGLIIPIVIMAAWTIYADYFLPATTLTMQLKVVSIFESEKVCAC